MEDFKIGIITQDGCGHCESAKKILADKLESGEIKELNINHDKSALQLARNLGVKGTPTLIMKDKITGNLEACSLSKDGTKALCKDKEVEL